MHFFFYRMQSAAPSNNKSKRQKLLRPRGKIYPLSWLHRHDFRPRGAANSRVHPLFEPLIFFFFFFLTLYNALIHIFFYVSHCWRNVCLHTERRYSNRYQNKLRSIKTGTRETVVVVVAARDFNSLCKEKKSAPFHSVDVSPVKPFDTWMWWCSRNRLFWKKK